MSKHKILLVEDEDSLATGLVDVLRAKGYEVQRESEGDKGLATALQSNFDLLLLDVELPGLNGFEILRSLREKGCSTRVMMLTARKAEIDRVLGFELGVDDYVSKPFSLAELMGRIKALLRRGSQLVDSPAVVEGDEPRILGAANIDLKNFKVSRDGKEVKLPTKAYAVLDFLLQQDGRVVSRDQLIDAVWGEEEYITQRTLNNLVVKIRQAIETEPENPEFLKTIHGVGYRLDVSVS